MEKPLDGNKLPTEVGQRVIDKPELPAGGIHTDNEVYTPVSNLVLQSRFRRNV